MRDSGIPYVVVRPVGLRNKQDDVPPIIKQCKPYEWGMCMISREVVGRMCVQALVEEKCANRTINCRENPDTKKGLKDFDWSGALCALAPDEPIAATFEDHVQALETKKSQVGQLFLLVLALGIGALYAASATPSA